MTNAELVNKNSFENMKQKNHTKMILRRILYVLLAVVMCGAFSLICAALFFNIKYIDVTGNGRYSQNAVIDASGVRLSENLYKINELEVASSIKKQCPYISSVVVKRKLPSTISIVVIEDKPAYYIDIFDEYYLLSGDLRVLQRFDSKEALLSEHSGVVYAVMPEQSYSVVGEHLGFIRESNYEYVKKTLASVMDSDLAATVDYIDCSNKYSAYMICSGGRYKIILGGDAELPAKLQFAQAIIKSSFSETSIALINVEYIESAIVTLENKLFT